MWLRTIFPEKIEQIYSILREENTDLWLLMGRETMDICDPGLKLVLPQDIMGVSAFFFTKAGTSMALVRRQDVAGLVKHQVFDQVAGYGEDFDDLLRETIVKLDPNRIDINVDLYDAMTDGLTAGLYLRLLKALEGTPYRDRLQYGKVIQAVRGRKVQPEIDVMTQCLRYLNECCQRLEKELLRPGVTEEQVYDFCQAFMKEKNLTSSWDNNCCPLVHAGPRAVQAMVHPGNNDLRPGDAFHLSFGAKLNGYATDFQRSWYLLGEGETQPPEDVQKAFDTIVSTIEYVRANLRPGMEGREIDAMARKRMAAAGYTYSRGCGHMVGMSLHDGVVQLSEDNRVLGDLPARRIEEGNVFTIELFADTSRGVVAVEDMMVARADGGHFLYKPQTQLWILKG